MRLTVSLIKDLRIGSKVNSGKFLLAFKRLYQGQQSVNLTRCLEVCRQKGLGSNAFKVAQKSDRQMPSSHVVRKKLQRKNKEVQMLEKFKVLRKTSLVKREKEDGSFILLFQESRQTYEVLCLGIHKLLLQRKRFWKEEYSSLFKILIILLVSLTWPKASQPS